jgi:DNA-binding NarL/FixJ family response regulator
VLQKNNRSDMRKAPVGADGRISLAVIGADRLMRDFLRKCLPSSDARFDCVVDMSVEEQAVDRCRSHGVDLVVFDVHGHEARELILLEQIQAVENWALLVIAHGLPEYIVEGLIVRARCGVFSRDGSLDALGRAAFLVAMGGTYLDETAQQLLQRKIIRSLGSPLSHRERHVLQLVAEGYSTKEVANLLRLSNKTVDKYRTSVMQKLRVHDVVKLTHHAIRMGLVKV